MDSAEYAQWLGIGGGFTSKVFSIFKESHKLYINLHFLWSVLMIKTHFSQASPVEAPYCPLRWHWKRLVPHTGVGLTSANFSLGRKMLAAYLRSFRGVGSAWRWLILQLHFFLQMLFISNLLPGSLSTASPKAFLLPISTPPQRLLFCDGSHTRIFRNQLFKLTKPAKGDFLSVGLNNLYSNTPSRGFWCSWTYGASSPSLNFSHRPSYPELLPRLLEHGRLLPGEKERQQRSLHIIDGCGKKELVTSHSLGKTWGIADLLLF